jgi:hypothetical protein
MRAMVCSRSSDAEIRRDSNAALSSFISRLPAQEISEKGLEILGYDIPRTYLTNVAMKVTRVHFQKLFVPL